MLAKMTLTPEHVSVCDEEPSHEDFDVIDELDIDDQIRFAKSCRQLLSPQTTLNESTQGGSQVPMCRSPIMSPVESVELCVFSE